jgi:hypothetical protein
MKRWRISDSLAAGTILLVIPALVAQTVTMGASATADSESLAGSANYISPSRLPSPTRKYVAGFGKRLQTPGYERTVLDGTYTDNNGTVAATLTWQLPRNLQFKRSGSGPSLTYSATNGLLNSASVSAGDVKILESLLDDTAEAFFYGFGANRAYRLLGQRFRSDDGTTPNFHGPWYDVYEVTGPVNAQPTVPPRWKCYYFNSDTGLLAMTQYADDAGRQVTTRFSNWTSVNGESYPQQIVRFENGTPVFTFNVTSAVIGAAVSDGLFQIVP